MIDSNLKIIIKGVTYRYGNLPEDMKKQYEKEIINALAKRDFKIQETEQIEHIYKKPVKKTKKG